MRRLLREIHRLARDDGFTVFQNEVVRDFYDALGQGYSNGENEVALVKRLVDAVQGKSYGPISLHGAMLHGSRSYVEFNYRDQPVTKELGDMAILSMVTAGSERLLQRITIVQNKRTGGKSWGLDQEQLFMLKNFPPFSGHRGIFRGRDNVTFRDSSGCLGSYGLLAEPGEMLFASARLVSEFASGKKSVSHSDIASPGAVVPGSHRNGGFPFLLPYGRFHPKEWMFMLEEWFHEFGPGSSPFSAAEGFLGNVIFGRDLYDLTRSWTRLSIGEPTCVANIVVNGTVDAFSNFLLRSAGLGGLANLPFDELFGDRSFEGQMAVLAVQLEVEEVG